MSKNEAKELVKKFGIKAEAMISKMATKDRGLGQEIKLSGKAMTVSESLVQRAFVRLFDKNDNISST